MKRAPKITYYKPPQHRNQYGGSIVPWIVLCGLMVLCMMAWQRHVEHDIDRVSTDPNLLTSLLDSLDVATPHYRYGTKQARVLADLWQVSDEEVAQPVNIFRKR